MKKLFTLILISVGFYNVLTAQDIHLSQFYNSDQLLNPAKVGDFDGDYRVTANYRNQWNTQTLQPITTSILSFDKGFHYYSHQIDGGILVARDGFSGFQTVTTKILLSAGYSYQYKENKFRFGIQPGIVFNSTDLSRQTYPDSWNFGTGNFDIQTKESKNASAKYFDLNIGTQWSRKFKKFEPKVGFAINHINRPKDTYFSATSERMRARKVFHAEANYPLTDKITLQPKLLFMWTDNANDMVFGANVKHAINNKSIPSVYWGAHYRHGINRLVDAVIPTAGFKYKKFDFGFSYDVNVSSLSRNTELKTTFEFSLIYIAASSKSRYITLPCDRY